MEDEMVGGSVPPKGRFTQPRLLTLCYVTKAYVCLQLKSSGPLCFIILSLATSSRRRPGYRHSTHEWLVRNVRKLCCVHLRETRSRNVVLWNIVSYNAAYYVHDSCLVIYSWVLLYTWFHLKYRHSRRYELMAPIRQRLKLTIMVSVMFSYLFYNPLINHEQKGPSDVRVCRSLIGHYFSLKAQNWCDILFSFF